MESKNDTTISLRAVRDEDYEVETGRRHTFIVPLERPGELHVLLLSEIGVSTLADQPLRIVGHGVDVGARTDADGVFRHGEPVPHGEYDLEVEAGWYRIPAVLVGDAPHPVHVQHAVLPGEWEGPTEAELAAADDEPAETDED